MAKEENIANGVYPKWERPKKNVPVESIPKGDTVMVALNKTGGVKYRMPDGRSVTFNGNATALIGKPKGILPTGGEFGLTLVAKEDWEWILKTYGNQKIFTEGLCFATSNEHDTRMEAESRDDLRNGLEPIDPEKDPATAGLDDKEGKPKRGRRRSA